MSNAFINSISKRRTQYALGKNLPLPQLLVGISEGAELLPALAPEVPQLAGLVLIGSSGLDPQETGALQARRLGVQVVEISLRAENAAHHPMFYQAGVEEFLSLVRHAA